MITPEYDGKMTKGERQAFSFRIFKQTLWRIFRYSSVRLVSVILTVGLSVYLVLITLNLGGYVDTIMEGQISEAIGGMAMAGAFKDMETEARDQYIEQLKYQMEESMGLHDPLPLRTARWWFNGITLQWGNAERLKSMDRESTLVKDVIFSRLPYTLLLVGAANVLLFFICLWTAMMLSTRQGSFWDRLLASLTPISSAPSWVHGVILLAIFALELRILPFKGLFDGAVPDDPVQYTLQLLKHMVLPVAAVILSVFFQGVYTWRTFFMVHSGEDYVELAKAKGLPDRVVRRRYLLRPTLPSVITSFSLMLVSFWEGAIALESLFRWPGIGALFLQAVWGFDRPVVVGIVVIFAYLLGFSVILLDVIYAILDPRVRVGGNRIVVKRRSGRVRRLFKSVKNFFVREQTHFNKKPLNNVGVVPSEISMGRKDHLKAPKQEKWLSRILVPAIKQVFTYPMATIGMIIIVFLIGISIYTVIAIPYDKAVTYWHSEGWLLTPKMAKPAWMNFFRTEKLPESIYIDSLEPTEGVVSVKETVPYNETMTDIRMSFNFEYTADDFPQDLVVKFNTKFDEKKPFVTLLLTTPDEREIELDSFAIRDQLTFALSSQESRLVQSMGPTAVEKVFGDPKADFTIPLKGNYTFEVLALTFEDDVDVNIQGVFHGKVFGLFGTDSLRRDLTTAMLWGTPVALTFGVIGAVVTTTTSILIAAFSAWYGGIVDNILQRITEINLMLPALPIAVMVYILYSKSIWVILTIMVLLNIFGSSIKEYRAMFMQFKEAPFIEAAQSYGASNTRIIFKYLLPRIIQVMVPQLVISVPSFVFLEATLAYLGVAAPYLPTWGKVINMALNQGAFWGYYYWVLLPISMVLITGLAFAFVGFALDKILNPRLRNL